MRRREARIGLGLLALAIGSFAACTHRPRDERTVADVVALIGPQARDRLAPRLRSAGVASPPPEIALLAFKEERRLELWGRSDVTWRPIETYPILAASGHAGPKLREGDRQVPEGLYRIVALNPNSRFHLSMELDYPNAYDVAEATKVGREDLGGEIFIHGEAASIGCLAIGDPAIEELFVLVADVGIDNVRVIVSPRDPRGGSPLEPIPTLAFTSDLYRQIERDLRPFQSTGAGGV
jgi:hypothetical protein